MNFTDIALLAWMVGCCYFCIKCMKQTRQLNHYRYFVNQMAVPIAGHPIRLCCASLEVVLDGFEGKGPHGSYEALRKELNAAREQCTNELRSLK